MRTISSLFIITAGSAAYMLLRFVAAARRWYESPLPQFPAHTDRPAPKSSIPYQINAEDLSRFESEGGMVYSESYHDAKGRNAIAHAQQTGRK